MLRLFEPMCKNEIEENFYLLEWWLSENNFVKHLEHLTEHLLVFQTFGAPKSLFLKMNGETYW